MNLIKISNDPILGLVRKVEITQFLWNIESIRLELYTRVHFFSIQDESVEISNSRVKAYNVKFTADNTTDVGTQGIFIGEYDDWLTQYLNNPIILIDVLNGVIALRDSQGRFDI